MRWRIIRILWLKELWRHLADRGGIVLSFLLIGAALIVSLFSQDASEAGQMLGGVQLCYLDYWEGGPGDEPPWIRYLRNHPPRNSQLNVRFRHESRTTKDDEGRILYQAAAGAIQVRTRGVDASGRPRFVIWVWHPGDDPNVMRPYEEWFWQRTLDYFQGQAAPVEIVTRESPGFFPDANALIQVKEEGDSKRRILFWQGGNGASVLSGLPAAREMSLRSSKLGGRGDMRTWFITALIFFPLWMFSVYLMPALTCEERERGVLLAQVLSPVRPIEIVAAKYLFYPPLGLILAAIIAGVSNPQILTRPFFWASVFVISVGLTGLGMIIASLAANQRRASLGAMLYLMCVALLMFMSHQFGIPFLKYLVLEFYAPRIVHAALVNNVSPHRVDLFMAAVLSCVWIAVAAYLFRKRGWQ